MMKNMIQHTVRSVAQIFSGKKTTKKKAMNGPPQITTTTHKFTENIHKPDEYSAATENLPNEIDGRTDIKKMRLAMAIGNTKVDVLIFKE